MCVLCAEQEWPDWFTPSKNEKPKARNVARGLHPLGGELGPEDSRCGTCKHLVRRVQSKTWLKCEKTSMSRCSASDIRAKWRGCGQYEEAMQ